MFVANRTSYLHVFNFGEYLTNTDNRNYSDYTEK